MTIKIICGHDIFIENAIALSIRYKWTFEKQFKPVINTIYIVFGGHILFNMLLESQKRLLNRIHYILLNSEQSNSIYLNETNYIQLMKQNIVLDFSLKGTYYLKEVYNIYSPTLYWFEFIPSEPNEIRAYDIAFVGSRHPYRVKLLQEIELMFPNLNIIYDFNWKYSNPNTLTHLLKNTKVVLNIPFYTNNTLETHRIHKALSCGCDVISLPSSDVMTNRMYEDYIYIGLNIKSLIQQYFNHELSSKKSYTVLMKQLYSQYNNPFLTIVHNTHSILNSGCKRKYPNLRLI
jgi:hypothetical protein